MVLEFQLSVLFSGYRSCQNVKLNNFVFQHAVFFHVCYSVQFVCYFLLSSFLSYRCRNRYVLFPKESLKTHIILSIMINYEVY